MIYFFFFKQKTAYEMRISDWSSDVCSSDLVEIIGVRLELLTHGVALPLDRFAIGGVDAQKMGQLAVDGHDEGVGVIQVAGVAGAEIAIAIGVRDGGGAAVRLYSREDRKSTPSELQSLMRISYAVFCL